MQEWIQSVAGAVLGRRVSRSIGLTQASERGAKTVQNAARSIPSVYGFEQSVADRLRYDADRQRTSHHCPFSMWRMLDNLRRNAFIPSVVIDVGAYVGEWSKLARSVFVTTPVVMIEAHPEREPSLKSATQAIGGDVRYLIALLGATSGMTVPFYSMNSGGSSVLPERTTFSRKLVWLPMRALDEVIDWEIRDPIFLKLDVQGYELEVLKGATNLLRRTHVIMLEISLIEYNAGAPLLASVVSWMAAEGFVAYDACGFARRAADAALFQFDMLFVREDSVLRRHVPFFATEPVLRDPEESMR